jgi:sulfatase maturation enzyme AslB (radical SAM superfamily)
MRDMEDAMKSHQTYLIRRLIDKTEKALEYFKRNHDDFEVSCTIQGGEYLLTLPTSALKKALRKAKKYYKKELAEWEE